MAHTIQNSMVCLYLAFILNTLVPYTHALRLRIKDAAGGKAKEDCVLPGLNMLHKTRLHPDGTITLGVEIRPQLEHYDTTCRVPAGRDAR